MVYIFQMVENNQNKDCYMTHENSRNANISVHKCCRNIAMLIVFILLMAASFQQRKELSQQ